MQISSGMWSKNLELMDQWLLHHCYTFQICSAFLCGFIIPAISSLNQNEHSLVGIYYYSY